MAIRVWSVVVGAVVGGMAGALLGRRALVLDERRRQGEGGEGRPELEELQAKRSEQWQRVQGVVRRSAHDLRNPLTTIRARAELLKRSLGNGHSSELRHVEAILRSSQRLEAMVTQLSTAFREGTAEEGPIIEPLSEPEPSV